LIFIVLAFAAPGVAVTFDLSNPSGVLGTQQGYSAGSATLTAYGYKLDPGSVFAGPTIGAAENLFGNTGGANESGLGLANNVPSHGISLDYLVELDFSNLYSQGFRNFTLTIGGIQSGDFFRIYSFDAPSIPSSLEAPHGLAPDFIASSNIGSQTLDISTWVDAHHVFGVTGLGNLVLQSVTAAPDGGSTLVLLGLSSVGLMAAARRFGKNWPPGVLRSLPDFG
jgi:hypothetical protein